MERKRSRRDGDRARTGGRLAAVVFAALWVGLLGGYLVGSAGGGDDTSQAGPLEHQAAELSEELEAVRARLDRAQADLERSREGASASAERAERAERVARRAQARLRARIRAQRQRASRDRGRGARGAGQVAAERRSSDAAGTLARRCGMSRAEVVRLADHAAEAIQSGGAGPTSREQELAAALQATSASADEDCASVFAGMILSRLGR